MRPSSATPLSAVVTWSATVSVSVSDPSLVVIVSVVSPRKPEPLV